MGFLFCLVLSKMLLLTFSRMSILFIKQQKEILLVSFLLLYSDKKKLEKEWVYFASQFYRDGVRHGKKDMATGAGDQVIIVLSSAQKQRKNTKLIRCTSSDKIS